jgi:hypothetical protein
MTTLQFDLFLNNLVFVLPVARSFSAKQIGHAIDRQVAVLSSQSFVARFLL